VQKASSFHKYSIQTAMSGLFSKSSIISYKSVADVDHSVFWLV